MKIKEQDKNIVTKRTVTSKGMKIVLTRFDIRNTFWENIEFQIEYQGEPWVETTYKKKYEEEKSILSDKSISPFRRIEDLFSYWIEEDFSRVNFEKGCLLGNLAIEMGDVNRDIGNVVDRDFRSYERLSAKCLTEAKEANELNPSSDVEKLAEFIWNSWEGAILRMKASKSSRPLTIFQEIVHKIILN